MTRIVELFLKKLEKRFENEIKEYFHWIFLVSPAISILLTKYVGEVGEHFDILLIVISIFINFFLLWLVSFYEYRRTKELKLLQTFFLNVLPPSRKGGQLLHNIQISVIEDCQGAYFHEELEERFKKAPDPKRSKRIPIRDDNLIFKGVTCESIDTEDLSNEEIKQLENEFQESLQDNLSSSKALIVVRSQSLDEKPWVYKAVETWADKNSDSPCLFIRKKGEKYKKNDIADYYRWTYDDPKTLPWKLLRRAKQRSHAWRIQAAFNRAMVSNFFILLMMVLVIASLAVNDLDTEIKTRREKTSPVFRRQRDANYAALNKLYAQDDQYSKITETRGLTPEENESLQGIRNQIKDAWKTLAKQVRDEYKISYTNLDSGEELEISFWFRNEEAFEAQAFLTTESDQEIDHFVLTKPSAIGCTLESANHIAAWELPKNFFYRILNTGNDMNTYDFWGNRVQLGKNCKPADRESKPVGAIACVSLNPDVENPVNFTTGVCAFSRSADKSIFMENYNEFLHHIAGEVNKGVSPLLRNGELVLLLKRSDGDLSPIIASD